MKDTIKILSLLAAIVAIFLFVPFSKPLAVDCSSTNLGGDYTVSSSCAFPSDSTATIVADSTANANTGTPTGTTIVTGKYGSARSFNGSSDYIDAGTSSLFNLGSTDIGTISVWFKTSNTNKQALVSRVNASDPWDGFVFGINQNTNSTKLAFWDGANWHDAQTAVTDNNWHHGAITISGAALTFYLDGDSDGSAIIGNIGSLSQSLWIGKENTGGEYFSGTIDDVRIYDYARSATQIVEDMNNGSITGSGPIAHWRMDDGYINGVDNGDLTVAADQTLTVNAGQTIAWNPGKGITLESGASIAINTTGQLKQGYIWVSDPDGDGWYYDDTQVLADSQPTGYVRRSETIGSIFGDGSDGAVTFNTNTNLNTTAVAAGRIDPDAVVYPVTTIGTNTVTVSTANPNSPIGWWKMDEASGITAADSSGNGYTGTATGTTIVSGKSGNARSCNGSSDYIKTLAVSGPGVSNQPYSMSAWVKIDSGETDGNIIHMSGCTEGDGCWCLPIIMLDGGKFKAQSWTGTASSALGTTTPVADTWYHVATTWDASGGLKLYVNGVLEKTTAQGTYAASGANNYLWFGYGPASGCNDNQGWLDGTIDDVRIYNVALTQSDIASDAFSPSSSLAAGDIVLLANLQGDATNYGNVGKYEFLIVDSVSDNTITFTTDVQKIYGATDSNSVLTGQKIVIQRVPQYSSVTVSDGVTINANDWDGTSGGILAIKANGTLTLESSVYGSAINMDAKGYRGGAGNGLGSYADEGEGIKGVGTGSESDNEEGGGGGNPNSSGTSRGTGAAGGGYGTAGTAGGDCTAYCPSDSTGAPATDTLGAQTLATMFLGSGGGGNHDSTSRVGGDAGGIIYLAASTISNSGSITADGADGANHDYRMGGAGGGSGGTVYLIADSLTMGTDTITAAGGSGGTGYTDGSGTSGAGGAGGDGRIAAYYASSTSGSTSPSAYSSQISDAGNKIYLAEKGNKLLDFLAQSFDSIFK